MMRGIRQVGQRASRAVASGPALANSPVLSSRIFSAQADASGVTGDNEDLYDENRYGPKQADADLIQANWLADLIAMCPAWITKCEIVNMDMRVWVKKQHLKQMLLFLRDHTHAQYKQCQDICAIDWLGKSKDGADRFQVVYMLAAFHTGYTSLCTQPLPTTTIWTRP